MVMMSYHFHEARCTEKRFLIGSIRTSQTCEFVEKHQTGSSAVSMVSPTDTRFSQEPWDGRMDGAKSSSREL